MEELLQNTSNLVRHLTMQKCQTNSQCSPVPPEQNFWEDKEQKEEETWMNKLMPKPWSHGCTVLKSSARIVFDKNQISVVFGLCSWTRGSFLGWTKHEEHKRNLLLGKDFPPPPLLTRTIFPWNMKRSFPNAKVMQTGLNIEVKLESSGFLLPVLQEATHKGIASFFSFFLFWVLLLAFSPPLEKYNEFGPKPEPILFL